MSSTSFFLILPTPLKIAVIAFGGLFYFQVKHMRQGMQIQEAMPAEAAEAAEQAQDAARMVPARPKPLPGEAANKAAAKAKPLEITVHSDGSYGLAGKKLTSEQLGKALKAEATANAGRRVVISAGATTPYQMVVSALKLCKGSGLVNVSFSSMPVSP